MTSGSIQIYELRCPECMHRLNGVSSDKLFVCASCGDVYCATGGHLKKEALYIAAVPHPETFNGDEAASNGDEALTRDADSEVYEPLFLPFWRFTIEVHVTDAHQNDITRVSGADGLNAVWVPAFFEVRPNILGNPGMNLTMAKVTPTPTLWPADAQMLLPGGARRVDEAAIYVQPFVSGVLDRAHDISGYNISVTTHSAEYWALPFSHSSANSPVEMTLTDMLCGVTYPANMVERIDEIIMFRNNGLQ